MLDKLYLKLLDNTGATAVEYGLLASSIAVTILSAARLVGGNLKTVFNTVANAI